MKRMLGWMLALLMLLSGCTSMPETVETRAPAGTRNEASAAFSEAPPEEEGYDDEALAAENRFLGGYQYRTARIGDVLYFAEYGAPNVPMILALDLNTMEAFPLCTRPECEHNSTACGAYAGGFGSPVQLTAWRGQLYYLDHVLPHNILYRMDAVGSNRVKVMELSELSNPEGGWSDSWFGIYGDTLYQCVLGQYVEDAEIQNTAVLFRQPLESGSADRAEELLRVENAEQITACVDGSTLYCGVFVYEEEAGAFQLTVYGYDMEAGALTELWQGAAAEEAHSMTAEDGRLLFGISTAPMAISLADGSVTELPVNGYVTLLGEGVSMVLPHLDEGQERAEQCRVLDGAGKLLYEGRYYPERYQTVNARGSLEAKYVSASFAGSSGSRFYFLLEYAEYGRTEYALLVFDTETFTYETPYVLDWPHEEQHGTITVTDDDGNVRVYDYVTGKQISGPPEETTSEEQHGTED